MGTLAAVVALIAPVFAMIALGYALARFRIVSERVGQLIGRFVFDLAIPVLLFRTMANISAPDASPWALWTAYFGGAAVSGILGALLVRRLFAWPGTASSISGLGASYSNTVLIGLPLVLSFFGAAAAVPLFIIISIHLPVMIVVGTLFVEWTGTDRQSAMRTLVRQSARAIVTNPIIIGLLAGLAWRLTGLGLAAPVDLVLGWIAWIAVPSALFAMGLALDRFGLAGDPGPTAIVLACKLLLHPLAVWLLATRLFALPDIWTAVAVVFAAAPPGINVFLFASRYNVAVGAVSSAIALGTALSAVTITLICWGLGLHAP